MRSFRYVLPILLSFALSLTARSADGRKEWQMGEPIVTYWAGPGVNGGAPLNDASAQQLVEGGWNLAWCREGEMGMLTKYGLRGQLQDPLLTPATLDNPEKRAALDALIERVKNHPGLYAYYLTDEPPATAFSAWGKLAAYIRERDPAHLTYLNLLPIGAENSQLGTEGDMVGAYKEHLRQFVERFHPQLLSYDHYQFKNAADTSTYFMNLAMVRECGLTNGLPFLNIVQACSWHPGQEKVPMASRVPTPDEVRYLVYTTLAYGGQGISYYVYSFPGHLGGMAFQDGTPTPLFHEMKSINREFVAIAKELQSLHSQHVFHAGMQPPGTTPLPADFTFKLTPAPATVEFKMNQPVKGVCLGTFGGAAEPSAAPTHLLVVNLDYKSEQTVGVDGPAALEIFDATTGQWGPVGSARAELKLPKGGGKLLRVKQ